MATQLKKAVAKQFERADEHRNFKQNGYLDVVKFENGASFGKGIFQRGWRWSSDVKPIAETKSCEASHSGYCIKGSMTIRMDDGEELLIKAGDAFQIPPGHDAWVEGDETCEMIDFSGFSEYALPAQSKKVA